MTDETVSLVIKGKAYSGWEAVRISRSVERCPSSFDLQVSERYPDQPAEIDIRPFDACEIRIGGDTVLTGWVDRYQDVLSTSGHKIHILGRSLCEDIVDCSAMVPNGQISGASALRLAQQLAAPFGVKVASMAGNGPAIPQFNVSLGETPYEIIEEIARYAQFLVYDGPDGNLILVQAGAGGMMVGGFAQGINIQESSVALCGDQRYSEYHAAFMSTERLSDLGISGNMIGEADDKGVPRYRPLVIVSEQMVNGQLVAIQRAQWEMARRIGRSQAVSLVCDSWRDAAGKLWMPNALAPVSIPAQKLAPVEPWVISDVDFIIDDERGTVAEVRLMPKDAFLPEPSTLQPFDYQVYQSLLDSRLGESFGKEGL